ncbi:MAG: hypothetical protein J6K48_15610 [Lachnospiraceae bacterium]|nr:hypothetical protein [Lachnospiraceae bacterium]
MRRGELALLLSIVTLGLVGCSQSKTSDGCSISIEKDSTITHQIVGQFEQNYYEMDGLEALAAERVAEYCDENGAGCVTLESVEEQDNKILVNLKYNSPEDYNGFNNRELYVGALTEADSQGYELEKIAFVSSKGEPVELGYIDEQDAKRIIIIATKPGEEVLVNTYGKVLYINQSADSGMDVSIADKKSVHIDNPVREDGSGEEVLSYIIFE